VATSSPKRTTTTRPKAIFDIARAEQEFADSERPEPFTVALKSGEVVTLVDPSALDWQEAAALSAADTYLFLRTVIVDDDEYKAFTKESFPQKVARQMVDAYRDHYSLDIEPGN
jgi:hypothetical protein